MDNTLKMNNSLGYLDKILHMEPDNRVDGWFLMNSIGDTIMISAIYLLAVKFIGPRVMKDRNPVELRRIMLAYNIFQVCFNTWLVKEGSRTLFSEKFKFRCQPVDYSNDPEAQRTLRFLWWYFMTKFVDLLDTVFFVLRKKNNQLTGLHLVHHATIPIFAFLLPKYAGGGNAVVVTTINSLVHVVMYSYYFLAAAGVSPALLWWKKYLTSMQLVQFLVCFIHSVVEMIIPSCEFPRPITYCILFNASLYWVLFWNFYQESYKKKAKNQATDKTMEVKNAKSE